jgi:hypothetical protein
MSFASWRGFATILPPSRRKEIRPMGYAQKLNALVVCAAFAFIGAIVLGAF